jgi:hypothetical protein
MATFAILEATPIYYVVEISFADQSFRQLLATELLSGDLDTMLQVYADNYEQEWLALQPDPELA